MEEALQALDARLEVLERLLAEAECPKAGRGALQALVALEIAETPPPRPARQAQREVTTVPLAVAPAPMEPPTSRSRRRASRLRSPNPARPPPSVGRGDPGRAGARGGRRAPGGLSVREIGQVLGVAEDLLYRPVRELGRETTPVKEGTRWRRPAA